MRLTGQPRTRFTELLSEGFEGRADTVAYEEELKLQRRLAKKLGTVKVWEGVAGCGRVWGWADLGQVAA